MSSVPHGLAGTSADGAPTALTAVDTTRAAPAINTTARDVQVAASPLGTPNALVGDASTARIRTLAGFFKFIGDCVYFPWGQRLCSSAVRAAGIAQPAWFLQSLLTQLGSLHALFSPGLFASLQQAGVVVGRFIQGYFMGPGLITATAQVLTRLNPGTYLTPDALLTLAGSVAASVHQHFTEALSGQITQAGAVVGRFIQGFFLTPDARITAAAQFVGHRVPALAALLTLRGVVATFYQRGRQFFVTLRLTTALRREASRVLAGQVHGVAALLRDTGKVLAAQLGVAATLQAGYGFFGTFSALLQAATDFEALRTRFLAATEQVLGALGPAQITAGRSALLSISGVLRRAIVGAGYSASVPLQALLQAGRAFTATLTSSSTLSGAVATVRTVLRLLNATLQAAAALGPAQVGKRLVASMAPSAATIRAIDVARAAMLAATATVPKGLVLARAAFASTLTAAGSVVGTLVRSLAGALDAAAVLGPTQIGKLLAATLTLSSATMRAIDVARMATLTATAALARVLALARAAFSATLTFAGSLFAALSKTFAAALDPSAALGPAVVGKLFASSMSLVPVLRRAVDTVRAAALDASATLIKDLEGLARASFAAALVLTTDLLTQRGHVLDALLTALGVLGPQQVSKTGSGAVAPAPSSQHDIAHVLATTVPLSAVMASNLADPEIDSATLQILFDSATGEELFETSA